MPWSQYLLFGVLAVVFIVFMVRNSRKRTRDAAALSSSLVPGAEIMTTGGIFGTVESVDDENNKIVLKTSPTSQITIHRQAVGRVIPADSVQAPPVVPEAQPAQLNGEPLDGPAYGERVEPESAARGAERDVR